MKRAETSPARNNIKAGWICILTITNAGRKRGIPNSLRSSWMMNNHREAPVLKNGTPQQGWSLEEEEIRLSDGIRWRSSTREGVMVLETLNDLLGTIGPL
jgi:hypothetical protein